MKHIFLLVPTFFLSFAFADYVHAIDCKVYGISDSPQKLQCLFKNMEFSLYCKRGSYFLNNVPVISSYHLEVEEGDVPMVFKTKNLELTVTSETDSRFKADLVRNGQLLKGICFK